MTRLTVLLMILVHLFTPFCHGQWCEKLQNSNGIPTQSALLTRILSSTDGSSISFCPFIIEGDGCDLPQGIPIRPFLTLHCDVFLVPLGSFTSCSMNCPGRHLNISGTLSLDGPWMFLGATCGSILLQTLGTLIGYRTSWLNNTNASGQGAAIYAQSNSNLHLILPTFFGNVDLALFLDNTIAYVAQGMFSNNTGGVVYVKETDFTVAFYGNIFIGNHGTTVLVECSDQLPSNANSPGLISSVTWANNIFLQNRDDQDVNHDCVDYVGARQCLETSQLCNKTFLITHIPFSVPSSVPFSVPPTLLPSTQVPSFVPTRFPSAAPTLLPSQESYFSFNSRWSKDGRSWCIGLSSMSMYNGNVIRLRPCKNSDAQQWHFNLRTGQIHNKLSNTFCLASRGGRTGTWDGLELWNCSDDSSKWLVSPYDHTITYRPANSTITFPCVTLQEGMAKEAQILRLQPCAGNSIAQQWERI